jgi:hypothetical protein
MPNSPHAGHHLRSPAQRKRSESLWLKLDAHHSMFAQEPFPSTHIHIGPLNVLVIINGP